MRRKLRAGFTTGAATFLTAILFLTANFSPAAAQSRYGANYFPNVVLTTQDGKKVHFYDDVLKGKSVVIDMIYTTCGYACPLETARLAQVQKVLGDRVGKDIFFYSITIDPANDTPKVLKAYMEKYHIGPGWTFLTGKKSDIELIGKKLGLWNNEPDPNNPDGHTPSVLIGNEPGGQWMRNAATDNPKFLANMIGNWLNGWANAKPVEANVDYSKAPQISLHTQADKGRYIFASQCAACHTIGHGDKIGPDLQGVTNVRDHAWLERFITSPDKVLAAKDPLATALFKKYKEVRMPNLNLADVDLQNLLKFLADQSAAPTNTAAPAGTTKDAPSVDKSATGDNNTAAVKPDSGQPRN
ncbi:MAG TPA: SCO family protein [Candidatus Angelobacter sp.]|nr:SCO family protein [Candidatus Angelobacter sp.]